MYEAIVIGVSAGGMQILRQLFKGLSKGFEIPLIIVQHEVAHADDFLAHFLTKYTSIYVKQADEKEEILPNHAYLAPPGYHLLVDDDRVLALSTDPPVNYARPSIDVLFETAAEVYGKGLIGIILTGANADGSKGLQSVHKLGGLTIVQNPDSAEVSSMPERALALTPVDHVLNINEICTLLNKLPFLS